MRTHGRSRAARRDPTPDGDAAPEILFDPDAPSDEARTLIREGIPWVLEIGTGNGVFLADEAARHPDRNYLGIERDAEFFYKMKKRLIREAIPNARCIRAEVEDVLDHLVPDEALEEVILNFSDPWPKRRHRERRVFGPKFLDRMERVLRPGGRVRFKTDVGWYFNLAMTDLRQQPGWSIESAGPVDLQLLVTNFERKGREQGRSIWAFTAIWDSV
jgi:tRNA (guanine-N7-)-methyltransferase